MDRKTLSKVDDTGIEVWNQQPPNFDRREYGVVHRSWESAFTMVDWHRETIRVRTFRSGRQRTIQILAGEIGGF